MVCIENMVGPGDEANQQYYSNAYAPLKFQLDSTFMRFNIITLGEI